MKLALVIVALALGGCGKTIADLDASDDAYCRNVIQQRNDKDPNAYQGCRANMNSYRMQTVIRQAS